MRVAKLFMNGRSQAVRLPSEFRFPGSEVYIRRIAQTGDVILSKRPGWSSWDEYFALRDLESIPADFLGDRRDEIPQSRDPFET